MGNPRLWVQQTVQNQWWWFIKIQTISRTFEQIIWWYSSYDSDSWYRELEEWTQTIVNSFNATRGVTKQYSKQNPTSKDCFAPYNPKTWTPGCAPNHLSTEIENQNHLWPNLIHHLFQSTYGALVTINQHCSVSLLVIKTLFFRSNYNPKPEP